MNESLFCCHRRYVVILFSNNCSFIVGREKINNDDIIEHFNLLFDGALVILSDIYYDQNVEVLSIG